MALGSQELRPWLLALIRHFIDLGLCGRAGALLCQSLEGRGWKRVHRGRWGAVTAPSWFCNDSYRNKHV